MQQQIQAEYPELELPPLNAPALVAQIDRHAVWQAEQIKKFQAALRAVYGETPAPDIWAGDEEIAAWQGPLAVVERLRELRAEYPFVEQE